MKTFIRVTKQHTRQYTRQIRHYNIHPHIQHKRNNTYRTHNMMEVCKISSFCPVVKGKSEINQQINKLTFVFIILSKNYKVHNKYNLMIILIIVSSN